MKKIWKLKETQPIPKEISDFVGNKFLENLFIQRGLNTVEKIDIFLNPEKTKITSPFSFVDMEKSVKRINSAVENNEKIIIYGDFDADGVTSTALLYKTLKHIGANVEYYIPEREAENHGMNTKALINLISKHKAKLIITVDCGVSDTAQVSFANGFKVDVIITDHHEAPEILPEAFAIINPKAENALDKNLSIEEIEGLNQLAGVGVAFKLACAVLDYYKKYDFVDELLPLVAVGTVADVVPLRLENRAFVVSGLAQIAKGKNKGIKRLLETAGYKTENAINAETIAFGIAPRINAAGRLDTVDEALRLLISETPAEIEVCAISLNNYNKIRQEFSDNIYAEALDMLKKEPNDAAIVLYKEDWHIGIIGIVASKLVEKFYKPVFLMTKDENSGFIRCSARSVNGVHLHEVLVHNEELFEGYGGHSLAAGLAFDPSKNSFETVKKALNDTIFEMLEGEKPKPYVEVDVEMEDVDLDLIKTIQRLEPFGADNPNPLFMMNNLVLKQYKTMGTNNNHLKIFCENKNGKQFECVYWNHHELNIALNKEFNIVFYPKINVFNNNTTIQLDIQDTQSEYETEEKQTEFKIYDHRKKTNILSQICDYLSTTKVTTRVFAENKNIIKTLNEYSPITEKICNRNEISECGQIMFFDYPADEKLLKYLLKKTGAKTLHFMNYNNKKLSVDEYIRQFSGMIKYVANNKNGELNLLEIEAALGLNEDAAHLFIEMFEMLNMIEVEEKNSYTLHIKFKNPIELSKLKESDCYKDIEKELEKIYEYRNALCKENLESIC